MVSLNEIQNAYKQAQESSGGGSKFLTVGKTTVQFTWAVFVSPPVYFPYGAGDKGDEQKAKSDAWALANTNGLKPANGILTSIPGNDIPTSKSGKLDFDIQDFVSLWPNQNDVTLDDEQVKLMGSHKFPIEAVMDALIALGDNNPVDNEKWCLIAQIPDGWRKARGDKQTKTDAEGKEKKYDWRIHVVERVFANEAEAKAEAKKIKAGQTSKNSSLSVKAIAEKWTEESLQKQAGDFEQAIANTIKNSGASEAEAIVQVAGMFAIEPADVQFAITPF